MALRPYYQGYYEDTVSVRLELLRAHATGMLMPSPKASSQQAFSYPLGN